MLLVAGCGGGGEERRADARAELASLGVDARRPHKEFERAIENGDARVVELFIQAGLAAELESAMELARAARGWAVQMGGDGKPFDEVIELLSDADPARAGYELLRYLDRHDENDERVRRLNAISEQLEELQEVHRRRVSKWCDDQNGLFSDFIRCAETEIGTADELLEAADGYELRAADRQWVLDRCLHSDSVHSCVEKEATAHLAWRERKDSATAARPGTLSPGDVFSDPLRVGGDGPEMVVVPGGRFRMGCLSHDRDCREDEQPVREVAVATFALSRYEVTFDAWRACLVGRGCESRFADNGPRGRDDLPVRNASSVDAIRYVQWLSGEAGENYWLPSEAQWEYAARAGTTTKYTWGDEIGVNRANCDRDCGEDSRGAAPVGSFAPNAFGLHDMHGNVWEWVADTWKPNYEAAPSDGSARSMDTTDIMRGVVERRVLRGGSFATRSWSLRSANRIQRTWDQSGADIGFRVARRLKP